MWWIIGVILIQAAICAFLCNSLSKRKGYVGASFAVIGFFLGVFGLLYAMGLPLAKDDAMERLTRQEQQKAENHINSNENNEVRGNDAEYIANSVIDKANARKGTRSLILTVLMALAFTSFIVILIIVNESR